MQKSYRSYLEYKEMRRRTEASLHRPRTVLVHISLFLVVNIVMWLVAYPGFQQLSSGDHFAPGLFTAIWGFGLLIHSLWSYFHSGLSPASRETAVEAEMHKRLDADDSITDEDELFDMHQMLDEDIRQRAGYLFSLAWFTMVNSFAWGIWLVGGANAFGNEIWLTVLFAAYVFVIGGGALNFWRSGQREKKHLQSRSTGPSHKEKPRRASYFSSPEHDHLEIIEDDPRVFEKRKR